VRSYAEVSDTGNLEHAFFKAVGFSARGNNG
jgi:hypothetical protein